MKKEMLSQVMKTAWQFVKAMGVSMAEALKKAWANMKLAQHMKKGIVRFHFQKVDGTIREAWGTLSEDIMPPIEKGSQRKRNEFVQVYFDTEKQEYRSFKKFNLIY